MRSRGRAQVTRKPGAISIASMPRRSSGFAAGPCRRSEDAEDATVEIFMKVREKLGQYDPERPFSSWLYKVAANHCWDMLRRRHTRQDLETERRGERCRSNLPTPGSSRDSSRSRPTGELRAALAQLPPRARMVLIAALLCRLQLRRNRRSAAACAARRWASRSCGRAINCAACSRRNQPATHPDNR